MSEIEKLFVKNKEINLEAEYFQSNSRDEFPSLLICHPHPQFGGNMFNNVVSAIFNKLIKNNISSLRFNFRAVGKSTGTHSSGMGELSDVKTCANFLSKEKKCKKILICGYSYGAAIGCSIVNDSNTIVGFIAISFPWDFMGTSFKKLSQTSKPKLFIQGDRDEIASYDKFMEHYNFYNDPKEYRIVKGADHFYWGYEEQVASEVIKYYKSLY